MEVNKVIEGHFELPAEIARKIALLNSDLYFGPLYFNPEGETCCHMDEGAVPFNFSKAGDEVMDYLREEIPSTVYVDMDCEQVFDSEPQGYFDGDEDDEDAEWIEPYWENVYQVDDVYSALLGRELYGTIS